MRAALIVCASLTTIAMFLLASTSRNTSGFSEYYLPLLWINMGLVTVTLGLIGYQIHSLVYRVKNHVFGSRLTLKLVGLFAALGIIPVMLVYVVSVQFMTRSIESWFNVRVEKALESGLDLGQRALDHLRKEQERKGRQIAFQLSEGAVSEQQNLLHSLREQLDADSVSLISGSGRILMSSSKRPLTDAPRPPARELVFRAKHDGVLSNFDADRDGKVQIQVIAPLTAPLNPEASQVYLISTVPESLSEPTESVQDVYRDYQGISAGREELKRVYLLTLTMVLISTLFLSIAFAFLFSNRLAAPLSVLAEGTRAVAEGDFSPREAVSGADELSLLTRSFNQMTQQLEDARNATEKSRQDVESARAYLESILLNLSTGVLAFDTLFRIKTINQGAQHILNDGLDDLRDQPLPTWSRHVPFASAIYGHFMGNSDSHWQDQMAIEEEGINYCLLIRGSRLPETSGGGYVVVFDDITQLIQAQKLSAWSEVAQRLAHEIKNPLTPIQLSAERILFKLKSKLSDGDASFLVKSTAVIVDQVEAMKTMVNSFRLYAKLPSPKFASVDLNAFIRETIRLYDNAEVAVVADLDDELRPVLADVDQMRQVVHNLVQNGQDAQAEQEEPTVVRIITRSGEAPELIVEDNGPGIPETIMRRAFEPYVTTKAKGTGLGLAIVKRIVDEHHGVVALENKTPRGGRIVIHLTYA